MAIGARPSRSQTDNFELFNCSFGHTRLESTVRYPGIEVDDALAISEPVEP
jgi:hypothetical protein